MKRYGKLIKLALVAATFGLGSAYSAVNAQTTQTQPPEAPPQNQAQNRLPEQFADLGQLNLTPEQIQKVRDIWFDLEDQRKDAALKQRLAQRALSQAIESPTPNEALIAQRSQEVADAQANTIRVRSLAQARILQVLTPEQRMKIREIRRRNQELQNARQQQRGNGAGRVLQNPAVNTLTPAQRRALRRQQKP